MMDSGKGFNTAQVIDPDRAAFTHTPKVVAHKVNYHNKLGPVFFRVGKFHYNGTVIVFIFASGCCSLDWTGLYHSAVNTQKTFHRKTEKLNVSGTHKSSKRNRIGRAQFSVNIKCIGIIGGKSKKTRKINLITVASSYVFMNAVNFFGIFFLAILGRGKTKLNFATIIQARTNIISHTQKRIKAGTRTQLPPMPILFRQSG